MKYFCIINEKNSSSFENTIKTTYPRIKFIKGFDKLKEAIEPYDLAVFDNILELDSTGKNNLSTIYDNYLQLLDKRVDVMFDRSPNCDLSVIVLGINMLQAYGMKLPFKKMFQLVLNMEVLAYLNIRDAAALRKKNAQLSSSKSTGKSYGRPKGSVSDSDKARKAKKIILAESKDFYGSLSDEECISLTGVGRATFYRYKKQLKAEKR